MDTEKILYLACSANQSSNSDWKSQPSSPLLKVYNKLGGVVEGGGGDKDHPACERPVMLLRALGDVVVSRLRIAGLGIGGLGVDIATGLWYRAVCSEQLQIGKG